MNPNGLIPVLQDNGLTLFESGAILRYLGAKYGNDEFWPKDPTRRAELDKWAEWSKTTLCPVLIYHVFWTLVRTPKGDRDMNNLKTQVEKLGELMEMATAQIGDSGYIGGESLSFADIMFGHTLFRYFTLPFTRKELPDLSAYYGRLQTHVAYREHVMVDYSSLQVE
ncbi:MAG: glutathione S-transferase C-terminal domain-containing protein, partial [Pseudomonadota bacterium]